MSQPEQPPSYKKSKAPSIVVIPRTARVPFSAKVLSSSGWNVALIYFCNFALALLRRASPLLCLAIHAFSRHRLSLLPVCFLVISLMCRVGAFCVVNLSFIPLATKQEQLLLLGGRCYRRRRPQDSRMCCRGASRKNRSSFGCWAGRQGEMLLLRLYW